MSALTTGRRSERAARLVSFLLALIVYGVAHLALDAEVGSDEPSYLLFAHSLAFDLDADLRDDHADPDVVDRYYVAPLLGQHAYEYRPNGRWISIHGAGLALLLAPVLRLGGGVGAVRWVLVVAEALLAASLFGLLGQLGLGRGAWRWAAWAAVAFSLPLVALAGQVYPDVVGALFVIGALRVVLRPSPSGRSLAGASVAAAFLPWLHVRYGVLAAALGAGLLWRGWPLLHGRRRLLVAGPLALSAVLLGALFTRWYGSPLPTAPYDPRPDIPFFDQLRPEWSASTLYRYSVGAVLSPSSGWLPFAPVQWLGLVGVVAAVRRWGRPALVVAGAAALYLVALGGLDPDRNVQGRFLVVGIPLVAVPLLVVLRTGAVLRLAFVALAALSGVLAVGGVQAPDDLAGTNTGRTTLAVADRLSVVWPTFVDRSRPFWAAAPEPGSGEVGRIRPDGQVVADAGIDERGVLHRLDPLLVAPARYSVRAEVDAIGGEGRPVARVSVLADGVVVAERLLTADDLPGDELSAVDLDVELVGEAALSAEVTYEGRGEVRARLLTLRLASDPGLSAGLQTRFPSWPLSLLWMLGTLAVGLLAAERRRPADRRAGRP